MIEPLSKALFEKCKKKGVNVIRLEFSGGSDEGYLEVETTPHDAELVDEIREWAWIAYSYSGAGEGQPYGDNITYNIEDGTVSHDEWFTVEERSGVGTVTLEIADDD